MWFRLWLHAIWCDQTQENVGVIIHRDFFGKGAWLAFQEGILSFVLVRGAS